MNISNSLTAQKLADWLSNLNVKLDEESLDADADLFEALTALYEAHQLISAGDASEKTHERSEKARIVTKG